MSRWQQFGYAGNVVSFMRKGVKVKSAGSLRCNNEFGIDIIKPKACDDSNVMAFRSLKRPLGFAGFLGTSFDVPVVLGH